MADVPQQKSESAKSATALREEEVLALWKRERIFERSVEKDAPEGEFVFYDGPPFATGLPHMGHLLGSTIKDVVGRYKTMRGFRVERRWGWDCHGLPIENIVEKKLGLKSKKDIEALGVARFNEEARSTVLTYVAEWKAYVERLGRWVDFDRSYKTMDTSYIEAVWGALKKVHTDGRLYEGKKVLMYCPHCETPLAKAEIAMDNSYKDVTDEAVFVKFKLKSGNQKLGDVENAYILAWTTTPWTLPGNMALAVNPVETYVAVTIVDAKNDIRFQNGEVYVFMDGDVRRRLFGLFVPLEGSDGIFELDGTSHVTVKKKTIPGSDLVGLAYEPLYDIPQAREAANEKTWTVQAAEFVTTDEGTGVVHIAPMYGEDDYVLGKQLGLPMVELLNRSGTYNDAAPEFVRGQYFKKGSKEVVTDLEARGLVFSKHPHTHSYPHCYRCSTALIYNALSSWFIDIQSAKDRLLEENETVSWYPEHLKHGRFRHTVESAPDWNVSRNRYWASPLPIWKHEHTGAVHVIGSVAELRAHTKTSGNRYLMVRHGQAQSNVQGVIRSRDDTDNHLTERGTEQARTVALGLKASGITKIIASPLTRTRETAELIAAELGISPEAIIFDERLREWQLGVLEGKPITDLRAAYPSHTDRFSTRVEGGENLTDMKRRVGEALYEYEQTYRNETILIVGHEYTLWLATCIAHGATIEECLTIRGTTPDYVANGELRELSFVPLPHNADFELDLHRPYIDTLELVAEDGARLVRIPEVVDCWVESGAMPVAAPHALGEALTQPTRYPGDFIAEYIAQTRTWFYYMHVLGVLLFDRASFTHCVTTGTVLAEDGSKMSKSKGNFTDPLVNINRYGADALRLYLMGSVVMAAEDMSFRDEELKDMHNRFIGILANTYAFYTMYASENAPGATQPMSEHVLDRWVRARLHETSLAVTEALEGYSTPRAVRELREFVADLSTWYLRRSRERLKGQEGEAAQEEALGTFREVLETLSLLLAPLAPFIAEEMYRGVGGGAASVHLADWPARARLTAEDAEVLTRMAHTRTMVSQALEARAKAGIKVRQPLASLTIPTGVEVYEELILDEVNIKSIVRGADLALDTTVTPELQREGEVRELTRLVQEQRKNEGREPHEQLVLEVTDRMPEETKELVSSASLELKRKAGITSVRYVLIAEPTSFELKGYEARLAKE